MLKPYGDRYAVAESSWSCGANESLAALGAKESGADVSDTAWRLQDILAGIPAVGAATTGAFLPQM
ncbi:MAG: folate-binding protein, partial [Gammaproteobacteria bacterium]